MLALVRPIGAVLLSALTLSLAACRPEGPQVGPRADPLPPPEPGIRVSVASATASEARVTVRLAVTRDGARLDAAAAQALGLAWTLAALEPEPVSGLPAWRSVVLTGATIPSNPVAGPGTPEANVETGRSQPGAETGGAWQDEGFGIVSYTFETPLPGDVASTTTLRAGVFLPAGAVSETSTATIDFRPDRAPVTAARALVADGGCAACHGVLRAHGGTRTGPRICVTCHTWQHADPETVDPAAPAAATAATNPNPLELGRLVHRIHRGKYLPTLYTSSSQAPAPTLPATGGLPLPFNTARTGTTGKNPPIVGRRFAVVGDLRAEHVWGKIVSRTDNGQAARTMAMGVTFPRDHRDCEACHAGAADAPAALVAEASRRSCGGCHPDVWFGADPVPDTVHLAHPGGPMTDDLRCVECHVTSPERPTVLAPIAELHVAPFKSPRFNKPKVTILEVTDAVAGKQPTVKFTVEDRNGYLTDLDGPTPATDQAVPPSPVPRALTSLSLTLTGPADPDFVGVPGTPPLSETGSTVDVLPVTERPPLTLVADANGWFTYTMAYTIPQDAKGTWMLWMEASRSLSNTPFYDGTTNRFSWPYTNETIREAADSAITWVNVNGGTPAPRRTIVASERCSTCHMRLTGHGARTGPDAVRICSACHAPNRTDWRARNRDPVTRAVKVVGLATYDGIEERSTQFKVFIHRLHTGSGTGTANLAAISPYVIYGPRFYDEARFPADLARCTACHVGTSYRVESVPAGAKPTVANETATVQHAGTQVHTTCEATPPVTAACLGCHATVYAQTHAARYRIGDLETCASCHGAGAAYAIEKTHGFVAEE